MDSSLPLSDCISPLASTMPRDSDYTAFDQLPGPVIVLHGPRHVVAFSNRAHRHAFGSEAWQGRELASIASPLAEVALRERLDEIYRSGGRCRVEHAARTLAQVADETRLFDFVYSALHDGSGSIIGVIGQGIDINDGHRLQSELAESETRFHDIADTAPVMMWMMNPEQRCLWFNEPWLAFTGRSLAAELGHGWQDGIHPDDFARCRDICVPAFEQRKPFRVECRMRRHDGEWRVIDNSGVPRFASDGQFIGYIGSCLDITERVQTEEALRVVRERNDQQRRLYEAILSSTPDLVYIFDLQHRFIYANEGLLKMWGKSWDESIGRTCLELGYEPWHAEMHDREIDQVVATRQPIRGEVPFNGTFGRRIYDYIFVPVFDARGEIVAVGGTTRDVTERQQIEQKMRALAEQAAEADRRKTEFLAMLAHELRNPLAPLRNAVQIIERAGARPDLQQSATTIMRRQLAHMVRLVDDLLDVNRISRGNISLQIEATDLGSIVQQAVETCRPMLDRAGQQLDLQLPPTPIRLNADAVRLTQVFSNLLSNASKYSAAGTRMQLRVACESDEAVIAVRDEGIGIEADELPRVFEMFVQGEHHPREARSGLGIGLALVRALVDLHGGRVEARSAGRGQGSEFIVRLPLPRSTPSSPPQIASTEAATFSGNRVLIVDDNRDSADSMALALELLGNVTRTVYTGQQAIAAAAEFLPELVLLDIGLPDIDGYETCRRILARGPLPIVAVSGWGQSQDRERSAAAGFAAHLVKPVDHQTLARILHELLQQRVNASS